MQRRFILFLPTVFFLIFASSCGLPGARGGESTPSSAVSQPKTLTVLYDSTRYGSAWITQAAAAFKKTSPGVSIRLIGDADADDTLSRALQSSLNVPDIAFVQQTNWQYFAQHGWLLPLTDVYRSQSGGKTLSARLDPGLSGFGSYNGKNYVLPWTSGVSGFLYNAGLFAQNGWSVPRTGSELAALLLQMKAKHVTPFAWSGSDEALWDNIVHEWWAQAGGTAGIGTYLNMANAGVYAQQSRLTALTQFEQIVSDPANSVAGPENMDEASMMQALFKGRAAMVPGTAWLAGKYRSERPQGFALAMMRPPLPDGAAAANAEINYTAGGDFICITSACAQPAAAEKFIESVYSDSQAAEFLQLTGTPLALRTDAAAYADFETTDSCEVSVLDIWRNSKNVTFFSNRPVYYSRLLDWPYAGMPYLRIYNGDATAQQVFTENAEYAKKHWGSQ